MATVKALTGGTRDLNPQVLLLPLTVAANVPTGQFGAGVTRVQLPVPRYAAKNNRSIVMEVLGVEFLYNQLPQPGTGDGSNAVWGASVTTSSGTPTSLGDVQGDTGCIDQDSQAFITRAQAPITNNLVYTPRLAYYEDITDSAGHGLLVASDSISFICYISNNSGSAQTIGAYAKMNYRFKEVSLTEYIGIVQSQQDRFD